MRASVSWHVRAFGELPVVQSGARRFLEAAGLADQDCWSVVISLTEATTNALKFAGGGFVTLDHVEGAHPHVVLEVVDDGPGIDDPKRAVEDFYSEGSDWRSGMFVTPRRGNGTGLGSIRRMMDTIRLENRAEGGLRLVARKYLHARPSDKERS